MTTIVLLLMGFGTVLILSAIAVDPTTGKDVSILQTMSNIWNNDVNLSQTAPSSQNPTAANSAGNQGISGVPPNVVPNDTTGGVGSGGSTQYANQSQGQYS